MAQPLLATLVEPQLGRERPEIVYHYPASQASLAKVVATDGGYDVAERFELYCRGIELANGFHELTDGASCDDASSRSMRLAWQAAATCRSRAAARSIDHGLPDCTGCALGFDRLAMLASA